jgi:Txe/YoeB family toxin of toxin-antitoxin system
MAFLLLRTKQAKQDSVTCEHAGFKPKLDEIRAVLKRNPYERSQGFERLSGNLKGYCSRQINQGNRVLYKVIQNTEGAQDEHGNMYEGIVNVYRAWGHNYKKPAG